MPIGSRKCEQSEFLFQGNTTSEESSNFNFQGKTKDGHTIDMSKLHCRIMNCSIVCIVRSHKLKDK